MCRQIMMGVLRMSVVGVFLALVGTEAQAAICSSSKTLSTQSCCGWRTTSTGVKYCSLWCTGSQVCVNTIFGLGGSTMNDCIPGQTCPVTECTSYGTETVDTTVGTCDTDLDNLNPTCGITGLAICTNPANHFNFQGTPYTSSGSEQTTGQISVGNCDKKGKCTNQLKVEPTDTSAICANPNWNFLTFTASAFKGKSCFCPGGYANDGQCCATSSRAGSVGSTTCGTGNVYGTGASLGTPTCLKAYCTIDLSTYDPFTNFDLPYSCGTAVTCGGIFGNVCSPDF